jgi:outer membrane protein
MVHVRFAAELRLLFLLLVWVVLGQSQTRVQKLEPASSVPYAPTPGPAPQAPGQLPASGATTSEAPLLTLEDALSEANAHNRELTIAGLETSRTDNEIAAAKALKYPDIHVSGIGGEFLGQPGFYIKQGALGTYSNVGEIPAQRTEITFPHAVGLFVARANLPLSQRFRLNLGIRLLETTKTLRRQQQRLTRSEVGNNVRKAYYGLLQTEALLETAELSIKLFDEALRVARHALELQAVLPADVMDVETRLATAQLQVQQLRNGRDTQKEQINELMGRPIDTDFRTRNVAEADAAWGDLAEARRRALEARPEIAVAKTKLEQASLDRRLKAAEAIPEISLSANYFTTFNLTNAVPANLGLLGFLVDWQPITWGRRHAETEGKKKVEQEASLGIDETRQRILVEVGADYRSLEEARLQLKVSRLAQGAARERLRVTENQFKENVALLKDLLQAQTVASDASSQYAKALSQYWTARANFEKAIGE